MYIHVFSGVLLREIVASMGATATDAQQLTVGPTTTTWSTALEEVAQVAALETGHALLKSVTESVIERTAISEAVCRPNVHKVETALTNAEKHLLEFFKLYEEAKDVRSCAEKDWEIRAVAVRLYERWGRPCEAAWCSC